MLREIISESEWKDVREFLSPRIFSVVPLRKATRQFRKISSNYFDRAACEHALAHRQEWLDRKQLPVVLRSTHTVPLGDGALGGQRALEIYFHQLFYGHIAVLDMRYERFGGINGKVEWAPQPFYVEWDSEFQEAIQDMYLGFYCEDEDRYDRGLEGMGLMCAGDIFLEHFGGEEHEVSFKIHDFIETFRNTLHRCKKSKEKAHPNLIPLGIFIVTLYDQLEKLGGSYNPHKAFFEAVDVDEF
ncbi:hypothetical protein FIV42_23330 [Persicimonas caeni]|uniref:Uncharacterized protein n=1 Tax=Persicimonas caeni TaxID=2292766 RepID=A0A4Y6PZ23_PERCE|nr:hypothetical protein [Persicimonas caeni]QDG53568.1 hypothetical protein FIV42_23330 [Persicimonas caeni]QED34789.1 hypothetical protein FRD00_23325 [Persicimonas caeni]